MPSESFVIMFLTYVIGADNFFETATIKSIKTNKTASMINIDLLRALYCAIFILFNGVTEISVKLPLLQASEMRLVWRYTFSLLFSTSSYSVSTGKFAEVFDMMLSFSSVNLRIS